MPEPFVLSEVSVTSLDSSGISTHKEHILDDNDIYSAHVPRSFLNA